MQKGRKYLSKGSINSIIVHILFFLQVNGIVSYPRILIMLRWVKCSRFKFTKYSCAKRQFIVKEINE
jgi:hypothetical protein